MKVFFLLDYLSTMLNRMLIILNRLYFGHISEIATTKTVASANQQLFLAILS